MSIRWDSHRLAALVEDVKFLHESGVSPQHWPVRVGKTRVALVRTLYRQGESDLACLLKEEGDV